MVAMGSQNSIGHHLSRVSRGRGDIWIYLRQSSGKEMGRRMLYYNSSLNHSFLFSDISSLVDLNSTNAQN
jgi:hypothetical protein